MRAALSSRLACLFVVAMLVAACDHKERVDDNPAADAWGELSGRMNAQLASARERQQQLLSRIGNLALPAGTEDVTLSSTITDLQAARASLDDAVGKLQGVIAQTTADVGAALSSKDKRRAQQVVDASRSQFENAAAAIDPLFSSLEPKITVGEQIMQRLAAEIERELAQLRNLSAAGGSIDVTAIDFKVDSSDFDFTHPQSRATLDRLVTLGSMCREIRFGLTGHTSREGDAARNQALSLQRADAVKAYLISQGVEADKIVRTAGLGATQPKLAEPDPGSPAEAAMDPGQLENLRRQNRRVTIDVVEKCPSTDGRGAQVAPAAPVEAPQPPTAPTANVQPTATRPAPAPVMR